MNEDDLEKKRFEFLEKIGIEILINEMKNKHEEMYRKTDGHFFQPDPTNDFIFSQDQSEDAKKCLLKFMQLNHEKYETLVENLTVHSTRFRYIKAKWVVDILRTQGYMDIVAIKDDKTDVYEFLYENTFIDKIVKHLKEEITGALIERKHTIFDLESKVITKMFIENFHKGQKVLSDFKEALINLIQCKVNKDSAKYYLKIVEFRFIDKGLLISYETFEIPSLENYPSLKELYKQITNRLKEKYGFDCNGKPSKNLYDIVYLLRNGFLDLNDIGMLLTKFEKVESSDLLLQNVASFINKDNVGVLDSKDIEMLYSKLEKMEHRDLILQSVVSIINKDNVEQYKTFIEKNKTLITDKSKDLLILYLKTGECDSLDIIDVFWNSKTPHHVDYFHCFLKYFKNLTYQTMESYLMNHYGNGKSNTSKIYRKLLTGYSLNELCSNNTANLETIEAFISRYEEDLGTKFDFEKEANQFDLLLKIINREHNGEQDFEQEIFKIIGYFTTKKIPFKDDLSFFSAFRRYNFDLRQSLEIIRLHVEYLSRKTFKRIDRKLKISNTFNSDKELIENYIKLERKSRSLVASLCSNKQSSIDLLKLLLDSGMDVNKKEEKQFTRKFKLPIYNVIFNSDIEKFNLIKKYNVKIRDEHTVNCLRYIYYRNPTAEFGKMFFDYLLEKKITFKAKDILSGSEHIRPRFRPDFLEMFFKYKKEHPSLFEFNEEQMFTGLSDNITGNLSKIDAEAISSEVLAVFFKYMGDTIKNEDEMTSAKLINKFTYSNRFEIFEFNNIIRTCLDYGLYPDITRLMNDTEDKRILRLLFSEYQHLDFVKGNVKNAVLKTKNKELLNMLIENAPAETISNCTDSIVVMHGRTKIVADIILRIFSVHVEEMHINFSIDAKEIEKVVEIQKEIEKQKEIENSKESNQKDKESDEKNKKIDEKFEHIKETRVKLYSKLYPLMMNMVKSRNKMDREKDRDKEKDKEKFTFLLEFAAKSCMSLKINFLNTLSKPPRLYIRKEIRQKIETFVKSLYIRNKINPLFLGTSLVKIPRPILNFIINYYLLIYYQKPKETPKEKPRYESMDDDPLPNQHKRAIEIDELIITIPGSNKRHKSDKNNENDKEDI